MARKITKAKIDLSTESGRAKLAPRSSAYAHRLGAGVYLCLYVGSAKSTWRARVPGAADVSIGDAAAMTFDVAAAQVMALAAGVVDRTAPSSRTIGDAWAAYEDRARKTKTQAAVRNIVDHGKRIEPLFPAKLSGLTLPAMNKWRDGLLTAQRGPVTANKIVRSLKAALAADGAPGPWKDLTQLDERAVERQEAVVLDVDQIRTLVAACKAECPRLGMLVEALALTGARPGELRQVLVKDYRAGVLSIRAGKTGPRDLHLTPGTDRFFATITAGRDKGDLLLTRPDGSPWNDLDARRPLLRALARPEAEGVPPGATLYALRHGYITSAIYAGIPVFVIAKQCGTSEAMIQRTYGHVIAQMQVHAFNRMDALLGLAAE